MSKVQSPFFGHMSGSMAKIATYKFHGEDIIRSKAFEPKDANTVSQQAQRASFKLIAKAYQSFGGITDESFTDRRETESAYNAFMAANLPFAIDKSGGIPVIDYSKLIVSKGTLTDVVVTGGSAGATGISVGYKTFSHIPKVSASDQVVAFARMKTGELVVARQVRGSEQLATILISYPGVVASDVVCCYLFVLNADGNNASLSSYVEVV